MSVNPYQSPEMAIEPAEDNEGRSARRWVAAPAIGIWIAGAVHLGVGTISLGVVLVMWSKGPLNQNLISGLRYFGLACLLSVIGGLAMYCSRRFYRLDSKRAAISSCLLGVIMYPLCMVTLPLGIYGLIVLRRGDVQRELLRNTTGRTDTLAGASHVDT